MSSLTNTKQVAEEDLWRDVDIEPQHDGESTYGRGFVIRHHKTLRLSVALDVDEFLKIWRDLDGVTVIVRWISGSQFQDDQLMICILSEDVHQLWDFRTRLLQLMQRHEGASITAMTGWLEDYLADRHAA